MGIGNILVLSQVMTYILCCIFSFFVFVPMAVNKNGDFAGNCLLYATGYIEEGTTLTPSQIVVESWGPPGSCNFAITIGVFVLLISVAQIVRLSSHVFHETDSSFLGAFVTFILNIVITVMLFASAINVTHGYAVWCQLISEVAGCSVAGFIEDHWGQLSYIKPDNYAVELGMVQFGLWTELVLWIVICLLSVIKMIKYDRRESIIRSLGRERQRLLGPSYQPNI